MKRRMFMKKRSAILSLVLALAMVACMFTSVFAAGAPTKVTKKAIKDAGVQSVTTMKNEVDAEAFAKALCDQVKAGKYKLVDTATLKTWVDKKSAVVIDTMPKGWFVNRHIPGAVQATAGGEDGSKGPLFKMTSAEKRALYNTAKKGCTQYYNKTTKKWQNKKIAGAKTRVNWKKKVVVYCGFTKCQRSHQAAKYLKSKGFKNVYRYAGGISAWVDAKYDIEGADVD